MFDALGFFAFGVGSYGRRRGGQGTADGGKPTRIDRLFDDDSALPAPKPYNEPMDATKKFRVTSNSGFGGTGVYRGDKE
jgi:hypothetical protein